ncbi:hypothetical protein E1B28_005670 [Marasmius oreades]|uniref:Uncharacterized protein n=1 Tax=Marasmius oreades TaxID=181124 RepID=A0A9P7UUH2_9AGAR|nr:uncharacterized protein E1B28_005670 [Marasmius oreades]KAG7094862.1 hypothetical protein E1B28_005670 [Marasmius oreades]
MVSSPSSLAWMSTSQSSPGSPGGPRSSKKDAFRPNLPPDPFIGSDLDSHQPWAFQHEDLKQLLSAEQLGCKVILILGEPSSNDMDSLLVAPSLRDSLLLIVTSSPPQSLVISEQSPSVLILRILSPIALQDSVAHHLLSIFQRAEEVARRWRKFPDAFTKRSQLREHCPGGAFTVLEDYGFASNNSVSNHTRPVTPPPKSVPAPFVKRNPSSRLGSSFDALINFVPSSFSDKAIIKHIVLLTTLSQTFLVPTQWTSTQTVRYPTTSQSQPTSRAASPTYKRNSLNISSFARQFPSLLTSSNISLPEPESTAVANQTRSSSHPAIKTLSHSHSVPAPPSSFTTTSSLLSEPKSIRPHIIHVLPSSVPTHTLLPRNQSSSPAPFGPSVLQPHLRSVGSLKQETAKKSKLLQTIEQFLRSYTYPLTPPRSFNRYSDTSLRDDGGSSARNSPLSLVSASGSASDLGHDIHSRQARNMNERPAAYIVSEGMLGYRPHVANAPPFSSSVKDDSNSDSPAAVVEMLLLGLLDPGYPSSPSSAPNNASKVWIGHPNDVVIKPGGGSDGGGASALPTAANVQEEIEIKVVRRNSTMTDGLEGREEQGRIQDDWSRGSDSRTVYTDSRRVSIAISSSKPEARSSDSRASGSPTASSGGENPNTRTSTTSYDGIGGPPQKVAARTKDNRLSFTGTMRRMSNSWKVWIRKPVDVT